jgi:hypothetical protein
LCAVDLTPDRKQFRFIYFSKMARSWPDECIEPGEYIVENEWAGEMRVGSKEVQKTALEGGFIQHSCLQVMNEIRARWETSPGCALKPWDHETRLFVSKTPGMD